MTVLAPSSSPASSMFGRAAAPGLAVGALALAGWAGALALAPAPALQGWWTAFVFWSGPSFGALALMLVRRLTGGDWGEAFAPELEPAARAAPLLALFALPGLLSTPQVFDWAAHPAAVEAQVRRWYLDGPAFFTREAAILVGLSLIAWRLPRMEGPRGRLGAGLGLAFYGVAVSFAAVDWILSTQAHYTSSAAGMALATQQLASALAYAALQGRARPARSAAGDLGALLFATLLGLSYLLFMSYLVVWYGDRPEPDAWYLLRTRMAWRALVPAALALGLLLPSALLALRHATGTRAATAAAGTSALAGLACVTLWQVGAAFGVAALPATALAFLAQGGLFIAAAGEAPRLFGRTGRAVHAG